MGKIVRIFDINISADINIPAGKPDLYPLSDLKFSQASAATFLRAVENGDIPLNWAKAALSTIYDESRQSRRFEMKREDWAWLFDGCDDALLQSAQTHQDEFQQRLSVCLLHTSQTPLKWALSAHAPFGMRDKLDEHTRAQLPNLLGNAWDYLYVNQFRSNIWDTPLFQNPDIWKMWASRTNNDCPNFFPYLPPFIRYSGDYKGYQDWLLGLLSRPTRYRYYPFPYDVLYRAVILFQNTLGDYGNEWARFLSVHQSDNHSKAIGIIRDSVNLMCGYGVDTLNTPPCLQWFWKEFNPNSYEQTKKTERLLKAVHKGISYLSLEKEDAFMLLDLYRAHDDANVRYQPDTGKWHNMPNWSLWHEVKRQLGETPLSTLIGALKESPSKVLSERLIGQLLDSKGFSKNLDDILSDWEECAHTVCQKGATATLLDFVKNLKGIS